MASVGQVSQVVSSGRLSASEKKRQRLCLTMLVAMCLWKVPLRDAAPMRDSCHCLRDACLSCTHAFANVRFIFDYEFALVMHNCIIQRDSLTVRIIVASWHL